MTASAYSQVQTVLARHMEEPTSEELRNEFLGVAVSYFCANDACLFHDAAAPELLQVFGLYFDDAADKAGVEQLKAAMSTTLVGCMDCIVHYYDARRLFQDRYSSIHSHSLLENWRQKILEWDIERQSALLESFLVEIESINAAQPEVAKPRMKDLKRRAIFILFEVLKYPESLKNPKLNHLFTTFLMATQQGKGSLKLVDQILPGVLLLAFHQSKSVASWARDSLRKCEAEIQLEGMAEFEPILLDLFTHLVSSSSNTISTTATTDGEGQRFFFGKTLLKELFKSLGSIIASMSTDAIQTGLFAIMPELFRMFQSRLADDSAAVEAARSSQNEQGKSTTHFSNSIFPAVVTCMYFLAKKCPGVFQVSSQSESLLLCSTIASHPLFHQTLSSQAVGAAQNADNHVSTTLYWLRIHISSRPDIFDSLLLDVIGEQCLSHLHSTWDPLARVHLFTKILAPLLSSPNELFDRVSLGAKDVLFSLIIGLFDHEIHQSSLILPYSEVLQSETISRIKDCLIKSMSNLNIYFKRIHSSSSSTSSSSASANCDLDNNNCNNSFSVYLYHYTWSALVASKSFKIHLQNTVMSGYSQIGMIDEILPESSSSSIVPLYNTTLSSIRLVIADYLQKIGELDQSEIFAFVSKYKDDIPLWMVCPIEACSVSATKILLKMTDCEFLPLMHQSFSLMQKLASEYFPDSFCKATLFALSQFNDNCSLVPKPNMLLFVENLMKLFGDFLFVIYDIGAGGLTESKDGTEEVFGSFHSLDLPVLWCEVWKFVKNVLLSASVWAKKSNATRGTIRKILPGIFDLTTFLLDYPPPLITESSQLYSTKNNSSTSLLTIIFFESLIETFPWFSALNKYYRSESVDLACRMLIYAANKANWEIPHDITKQLEGLATGQIASQLDEPEKKRLIMWNTEVVDEEEEVEEKVAAANSTFSSSAEHHNPLRASFNSTTNELVSSTSPSSYSTSSSRPQKIEYYSGYELSGKSANIPSMYKEVDSAWLQMAKARKLSQSTMKKSSKKSGVKSSAMKLLRSEVLSSTTAPRVKSSSFPAQTYSSASSNASLSLAPRFKVEVLEPSADLSAFHDSLTPEKPKRSMQVIDLPNSKKSATERRLEEKTVAAFKPKPLGDISSLHMQILSWEFPPEDKLLTPPNFDSDSLKSIPSTFNNSAEYSSVFEPLMVIECWEQFCHAREEVREDETVFSRLESSIAVDGFYDLTLQAPTSEVRMKGIQDYEIVQINEVSVNDKTTSVGVAPILAKVNSVYAKHDISTITLRIYPSNRRPDVVPRLRPSSGWSMFRIFSLVTAHREYLAMLNMPLIPLSCDIMNPKKSNSLPPKKDPIAIKDIMRKFQVNEPQASAVNAAITQRSGFVLIQGPPGTGKTKTILTMIGCLLSQSTVGNKISMPGSIGSSSSMMRAPIKQSATMSSGSAAAEKRRILCCAPSNAACDEIIKRLRMGIADFSGKKRFIPSVVRLGSVNSAHPDVKDVTLELLVEEKFMEAKEFQQFMRSTTASSERETTMKKELDSLTKHREELKLKLVAAEDGVTHDSISGLLRQVNDRRKDILRDLYERKEKKADNVKVLDNVKLMVRKKVLVDADVVCCTLSTAGSDFLLNSKLEFPIVIIDEACQSIELSSLIPLKYQAKKCILVGDPNQLPPTVLSTLGKDFAYEQSLFQRIMSSAPNRVHLLGIQYRMHPEISKFPSKLFYDSKLLDGEGLEEKKKAVWHEESLLSPYRFFNVSGREQSRSGGKSVFNLAEVDACVSLIQKLCEAFPSVNFANRIGVITPYKAQFRKLKEKLISIGGDNIVKSIDINTVDGFQGQEKDIIILSCVRGGVDRGIGFLGDVRRMNVAFTRARHSLFVLGNAPALKSNVSWRCFVEDAESRGLMTEFDARALELPVRATSFPSNLFFTSEESGGIGGGGGGGEESIGKRKPSSSFQSDQYKKPRH